MIGNGTPKSQSNIPRPNPMTDLLSLCLLTNADPLGEFHQGTRGAGVTASAFAGLPSEQICHFLLKRFVDRLALAAFVVKPRRFCFDRP
jgi:hypothetical protein